jgi:hypothetical protein
MPSGIGEWAMGGPNSGTALPALIDLNKEWKPSLCLQLLQDGVSFCLGSVLEHAVELEKLLPVLLYAAQLL